MRLAGYSCGGPVFATDIQLRRRSMMRQQLRSSLTAIWFTLAFGITPANAGDMNARLDKASEMILIIEKEGTLDQALNMVFMSAPEANRAELRQLIDGYLDRKALYAEWGRIAADIFTIEEMDALISFYSTPVGRSILEKRLQMNQRVAVSLMEMVTKSIEKAQKK